MTTRAMIAPSSTSIRKRERKKETKIVWKSTTSIRRRHDTMLAFSQILAIVIVAVAVTFKNISTTTPIFVKATSSASESLPPSSSSSSSVPLPTASMERLPSDLVARTTRGGARGFGVGSDEHKRNVKGVASTDSPLRSALKRASATTKSKVQTTSSTTATATCNSDKFVVSTIVDKIYTRWWFHGVPQVFRFCFAGSLANLFFLWLEHTLYVWTTNSAIAPFVLTTVFEVEEEHAATISYTAAYLLQIVSTHFLNALLVYGLSTVDTLPKYLTTLRRQFYAYSTGMVLSVMLFGYLTSSTRPEWLLWMDRRTALWTTTFIIAGINYVVIGKIMNTNQGNDNSSSEKSTNAVATPSARTTLKPEKSRVGTAFIKLTPAKTTTEGIKGLVTKKRSD